MSVCRLGHQTIRPLSINQLQFHLQPQGNLVIDCSRLVKVSVNITSQWQDFCAWSASSNIDIHHQVDGDSGDILLEASPKGNASNTDCMSIPTVEVSIPEMVNVSIGARNLHLTQKHKVMGDFHVSCSEGDIHLDKIKGSRIELSVGKGTYYA